MRDIAQSDNNHINLLGNWQAQYLALTYNVLVCRFI